MGLFDSKSNPATGQWAPESGVLIPASAEGRAHAERYRASVYTAARLVYEQAIVNQEAVALESGRQPLAAEPTGMPEVGRVVTSAVAAEAMIEAARKSAAESYADA